MHAKITTIWETTVNGKINIRQFSKLFELKFFPYLTLLVASGSLDWTSKAEDCLRIDLFKRLLGKRGRVNSSRVNLSGLAGTGNEASTTSAAVEGLLNIASGSSGS